MLVECAGKTHRHFFLMQWGNGPITFKITWLTFRCHKSVSKAASVIFKLRSCIHGINLCTYLGFSPPQSLSTLLWIKWVCKFWAFYFLFTQKKKNQPADWSDVSERKKQEEGSVLLPTSVCIKEKTQLIFGGVNLKEGQRRVFKSHEDDLYLTWQKVTTWRRLLGSFCFCILVCPLTRSSGLRLLKWLG